MSGCLYTGKMMFRSAIIDTTAALMNWVSYLHTDGPTTWRDRTEWWLNEKIGKVFDWGYAGSIEELEAVTDGEIPPYAMSPRQLDFLCELLSDDQADVVACCFHCNWTGTYFDSASNDCCPKCGKHIRVEVSFKIAGGAA